MPAARSLPAGSFPSDPSLPCSTVRLIRHLTAASKLPHPPSRVPRQESLQLRHRDPFRPKCGNRESRHSEQEGQRPHPKFLMEIALHFQFEIRKPRTVRAVYLWDIVSSGPWRSWRRTGSELLARGNDHICLLHFDEAAAAAVLQLGHDLVHFFSSVDEFDLDGQVIGELEDVGGVDAMMAAEPGYAFEYCCAGDAVFVEKIENAGVDGDSLVLRGVAQVDGDFDGFASGQHGCSFFQPRSIVMRAACTRGQRGIGTPIPGMMQVLPRSWLDAEGA